MKKFWLCPGILAAFVVAMAPTGVAPSQDARLEPTELVGRHLASVASAETRTARASNVADGSVRVTFLIAGSGSEQGQALFFSKGPMTRLTLSFQNQQYRGEDIVFDGREFSVGHATTTARSPLGAFLHTYNSIIKEGLMGSVLSTAWPLFNLKARGPRLQYRGLRQLGERRVHRLDYRMKKGGGDIAISLYFDPESYRHLNTTYEVRIAAPMGKDLRDSSPRETHYELVESFDDFQQVEGMTLPRRWTLRFSVDGSTSVLWEWDIRFAKIAPNEPVG